MLKKRAGYLLISLILPILAIACLFELYNAKLNDANGFIRVLPSHLVRPGNTRNLRSNGFYIAGLTKDSVYLANHSTPYLLTIVSYDLKTAATRRVNWPNAVKISKGAVMSIDSPYLRLDDGMAGQKLSLNINDNSDTKVIKTLPFITSTGSIYRSINMEKKSVLVKQGLSPKPVAYNRTLLKPQGDDVFSTDGMLLEVPKTNRIVYVYYYRNQFLSIDTNLNLIYQGKTIDTISRAHIQIARVKSEGSITMSAPPLIVNKKGCVSEKYIFINSNLNASNEPRRILDIAEIIDVYNLKDGKYKFSFYLPNIGGKKAKDFKVYQHKLVAIYGQYLTVYTLNFD